MSDLEIHPVAAAVPPEPGLSQMERVTSTFSAPSKVFEDIKTGHRSWWLPFLMAVIAGYILFAAITIKVGWAQVAENAIRIDPKAADKMAQSPPDQRAMIMKFTQYSMEGAVAASPILILIVVALGSLVLWGTINFVFGGKATFGAVFAMWMYASLPRLIQTLLGAIITFTTGTPDTFNLNNFAPTNIGAFLSPTETNAALYKLATALDFTTIWNLVLLSIGLAIVAKVKRSSGYIAVFGWWALIVLISVGYKAVTG